MKRLGRGRLSSDAEFQDLIAKMGFANNQPHLPELMRESLIVLARTWLNSSMNSSSPRRA